MIKKQNLKAFNLYQYLKEQNRHSMDIPYFLADQNTYKDAEIRFPFRTFNYGIGITYSGASGLFRIGSTDYTVSAGCLITIGPGIVSQWMSDYSAVHDTIYFNEDIFINAISVPSLRSLPFFSPGGNHVIKLNNEQKNKIKSIFKLIREFINDKGVITGLVYSLLMFINKCHNIQEKKADSLISNKEKIARTFRSLLAKHFSEQKDVSFYASKLNITPKYLSEVLLSVLGKSAKILIDEYIAMEAKSLLRQTNMSVQEICYWLGYDDASYFTKAFKKWESITPLSYRNL